MLVTLLPAAVIPGPLQLGHLRGQAVAVLRAPVWTMGCRWTAGCSPRNSRTNGDKLSLPSFLPGVQSGFAIKQTTAQTRCLVQKCRDTHPEQHQPGPREWGERGREGSLGSWRGTRGQAAADTAACSRSPSSLCGCPAHSGQATTERWSPQEGKPHILSRHLCPAVGCLALCSGANIPSGER